MDRIVENHQRGLADRFVVRRNGMAIQNVQRQIHGRPHPRVNILLQRFIRQNFLRTGDRRILREILRKRFDLLHGIIT